MIKKAFLKIDSFIDKLTKPIASRINSLKNKTLIYSIKRGLIFSIVVVIIYFFYFAVLYFLKIPIIWLKGIPEWLGTLIALLSMLAVVFISFIIGTFLVYLYLKIEFWILWNFSKSYRKKGLKWLESSGKLKELESSGKLKSSFRSYKYSSDNQNNHKNKKQQFSKTKSR